MNTKFKKFRIQNSGLRIFLLLTTNYGLLTTGYCYSLFSSAGLGEPVDIWSAETRGMGGLFKQEIPKDLTFECSLLFESVETHCNVPLQVGGTKNFDFTLPRFRFLLPLPRSTAIDIELNELLDLNFDLQDEWQEFAGDSVQRRVKGRGSVSTGKVGACKTITLLSIEAGGFVVFGSSIEEWVADFGRMDDACDTVNLKFGGAGGMGSVGLELGKFNLSAGYFSASRLSSKNRLPQRFKSSMIFRPMDKIKMGVGITQWQWQEPFKPMRRVSIGGEINIGRAGTSPAPTLRAGFYTGNWYYEIYEHGAVHENVGSLGIGVLLKSLCKIDLSFEFGKRYTSLLEEKIYRICISFQGRENL